MMEVEDSQNGLDDENSTLPEESQEGEEDENSNSESNLFGDENSNSLKPDDSQLISGEVKENEAKKNEEGVVHEIPESSVRKWKKKWITVEHMKLLKWVPVGAPRDPKARAIFMASSKKNLRRYQSQQGFNDHAPITRSVSAAFNQNTTDRGKRAKIAALPRRSSTRLRIKEESKERTKTQNANAANDDSNDEAQEDGPASMMSTIKFSQPLTSYPQNQPFQLSQTPSAPQSLFQLPQRSLMETEPTKGITSKYEGLITNDVPLELPVPISSSTTSNNNTIIPDTQPATPVGSKRGLSGATSEENQRASRRRKTEEDEVVDEVVEEVEEDEGSNDGFDDDSTF